MTPTKSSMATSSLSYASLSYASSPPVPTDVRHTSSMQGRTPKETQVVGVPLGMVGYPFQPMTAWFFLM